MGAWSHEPFGNDTACDWGYELIESKDLSAIDRAIDEALKSSDYLDADVGCEAIAAIEVLAKLKGKGSQSDAYTEEIDNWVEKNDATPSTQLLSKATLVLDLVLSDASELKELWDETEDTAWSQSIKELRIAVGT